MSADTSRFKSGLKKGVEEGAGGAGKSFTGLSRAAGREGEHAGQNFAHRFKHGLRDIALTGAGFVGLVGLEEGLRTVTERAFEAEKATKLTESVIKSTGGVAQVSGKHIEGLAYAISRKVGVDHNAIQSGENLLLTFTNIRNESGKGNKIFDQATHSLVDLGAALAATSGGQINFRSATTLVGKALQDPIRGLTSLSRVGVFFDDKQKGIIKGLVQSGHVMKAQKIILGELQKKFHGAAASQATDAAKAKVAIQDLEEKIGKDLLPVISRLANWTTTKAVPAVEKFIDQMHSGEGAGGQFANTLSTLLHAGEGLLHLFNGLPAPVKKYGIELLIGMAIMSKFSGGITSLAGSFTLSSAQIEAGVTRQQLALTKLKGAAINIAGAGGLLLIADSANRTNRSMGLLEKTAGGALSGAALGAFAGPEGALVGGALGALATGGWGLVKAMKETSTATNGAKGSVKDYTDTLHVGTHAITSYTRALVAKHAVETGAIEQGRELGLTSKTVVNAMLGQKGAVEKVAAAQARADRINARSTKITYDQYGNVKDVTDTTTAAQRKFIKAAEELGGTVRGNQAILTADIIKQNELALSLGKYAKVLPGIPKNVATRIDQIGLQKAVTDIVGLTAKYKLTPPEVRTVLAAANVKPTEAQIAAIIAQAKILGAQKPTVKVSAETTEAHKQLSTLMTYINGLTGTVNVGIKHHNVGGVSSLLGATPGQNASGTDYWRGGPTWVGEHGRELLDLPRGARIYSATESRRMMQARPLALAADRTRSTSYPTTADHSRSVTLQVVNPVAERTSDSLPRALNTLAFVVGAS